ncbi:MAG: hypothetical protein K6T61_13540 [Bryobacteraceae bacterium]|nr:hypothetical protein [Bryobacteraceae bacterium]
MRAALILMVAAGALASQTAPPEDIVLIPFQVTQKNAFVTDLQPDEIELRIDGAAQKLILFEGPRTQPRTIPTEIIFLFDCDRNTVANSGLAPRLFHQYLLDGRDHLRVSVYGFSGGLVRLAEPTRDEAVLRKAMDAGFFVHPLGTFLLDFIRQIAEDASSRGPAVRLLVALSSGVSDTADASQAAKRQRFDATVLAAQRAGMSVHPVVLRQPFGIQAETSSPVTVPGPAAGRGEIPRAAAAADMATQSALRSLGDFTNLASATGGQSQEVLAGTGFLPGLLKSLSKLVQDQYVAGFVPSRADPPKRRRVELVLKNKNRGRMAVGIRNLIY